ncbi:amino acid ABC transporter ATP-binding/permease protein [Marinomonas atlantica]|uniref:amino acid ABC transporter ATP-binding/permease protein n=1 Tax=Marinomonas atlantica TaxID=1806668 RepID=UPI000832E125|nr:ATP-binding cassette domain-containing protein [Marinomonas atlantica]MCO4786234.1 ATP-binding cassette domain-containing protein [Marinomonas atlantica]
MSKHNPQSLTFKSLLLDNPFGLLVALLIGIVGSLAAVALLGISGWFLSAAGLASAMGTAFTFNYFTPGALVRLMAILRTAGRYGEQVFSHDHLLGLLRSLRLWIWDQRVNTPLNQVHRQTKGDLLQRLVGDLDQIIKWPLAVVMPWVYGLLGCIALLTLGVWVEASLVWPIITYSIMQLLCLPWLAKQLAMSSVYSMQALSVHRRSRFMSVFSALITLTIRGHWQHYSERLTQLDEKQRKLQAQLQRVTSLVKLLGHTMTLLLVGVMFALCLSVENESLAIEPTISATWLVALVLATLGVNELMQPIASAFLAQGQSKVGLKRLNQLQRSVLETADKSKSLPSIKSLNVRNFAGSHNDVVSSALPSVNFTISSNEQIKIVGASGAGKSTTLAALAGDLGYRGEVRLNSAPVSVYDNSCWREKVSYLSQQSVIFQQSLRSNLLLGKPDATETELFDVLQLLGLKTWVDALPSGLDTLLGGQGRDISGGQARRLCLARILLRKAPTLILDEPFDGLDSDSVDRVCKALERPLYKPQFLIYVSHIDSPLDRHSALVAL